MDNRYANSCGCGKPEMPRPPHKDKKNLAMAYVQWQRWQNVMDSCNALKHGTIFEELVLPFEGTRAACSSFPRRERPSGNFNNNNYRRGMR